jgi:hypothetical protein
VESQRRVKTPHLHRNTNANKRGDVCVDADQDILDIPSDDGATSEDCSDTGGTQLDNGNTDLMEP